MLRTLNLFRCLTVVMAASWVAVDTQAEEKVDGKTLYEKHCSVCHGDQGDGNTRARSGLNPPPRDFTTPVAREELSRERMLMSVTHGRPGTAMMSFESRLSQAEIAAVVNYVRATFMKNSTAGSKITTPKMERGRNIYVRNCAVCHGDNGSGAMWTSTSLNPAPRDFTASKAYEELSRERMLTSVTHGRPGTAMMSFSGRLSADEIEAVVDYIRASFMSAPAVPETRMAAAPADMSLPFSAGLKGDVGKGREFYHKNCFTCHGDRGNGEGPRSRFIQPRPRDFLSGDARRRLNRPALHKAITEGLRGTVMPAWGRVLSDQEIADVAEYVFQAFIRPGQAAPKKKLPRQPG